MIIDVKIGGKIEAIDTHKYNLNGNGRFFYLFRSPNHPLKQIEKIEDKGNDISKYTSLFINDSFCLIDEKINKLWLVRDFPGSIILYYWQDSLKNPKHILVSDSLKEIINQVPNPKISGMGAKLFLLDRKHYQTHTIYENVEVLHAGFYIELDLTNGNYDIKYWYKPFKQITVFKENEAIISYKNALDEVILRTIPKDKPVVLAFSGGSDSMLLLERFLLLDYKNIELFNIQVGDLPSSYAYKNAAYLGKEKNINIVRNYPYKAIKHWQTLIRICYCNLSEMRMGSGMFSSAIAFWEELKKYYKSEPVSVVWGFQEALASPVIDSRGIIKFYISYIFLRLLRLFNKEESNLFSRTVQFIFRNSSVLDLIRINPIQKRAFFDIYKEAAKTVRHPDELINLFLSLNYNHLKHWLTHWRDTVRKQYYPSAMNSYPFHDRIFQEATMRFSLLVRIGGIKNVFKMPKKKKEFFIKIFEKKIPSKDILNTNYIDLARDNYFSRSKEYYELLINILTENKNKLFVDFISQSCGYKIPSSYEEFVAYDDYKIEKLAGTVIMLSRFDADNVEYSEFNK